MPRVRWARPKGFAEYVPVGPDHGIRIRVLGLDRRDPLLRPLRGWNRPVVEPDAGYRVPFIGADGGYRVPFAAPEAGWKSPSVLRGLWIARLDMRFGS